VDFVSVGIIPITVLVLKVVDLVEQSRDKRIYKRRFFRWVGKGWVRN